MWYAVNQHWYFVQFQQPITWRNAELVTECQRDIGVSWIYACRLPCVFSTAFGFQYAILIVLLCSQIILLAIGNLSKDFWETAHGITASLCNSISIEIDDCFRSREVSRQIFVINSFGTTTKLTTTKPCRISHSVDIIISGMPQALRRLN